MGDKGTKPTNPKDAIGFTKLPLGNVPDTAIAYMSLSFLEGALKYGRFNWRSSGVRSSIYHDALKRHLAKWWNGEDCDTVTKVPHLASVMACAAIILDAELCGKLNDDRPPQAPMGALIDKQVEIVAHLKELFKGHSPHQHSIQDKQVVVEKPVGTVWYYNGIRMDPQPTKEEADEFNTTTFGTPMVPKFIQDYSHLEQPWKHIV